LNIKNKIPRLLTIVTNPKKLIKELPSLVPSEDAAKSKFKVDGIATKSSEDSSIDSSRDSSRQSHPAPTLKKEITSEGVASPPAVAEAVAAAPSYDESETLTAAGNFGNHGEHHQQATAQRSDLNTIGKSPGEIAFFKLLHAEFKKATHFFERAQQEYIIREERVQKGMEIMKQPNSIMVGEKWSLLAKSIYRLYKELLLLETFAIMTYCGFSKILKKHDKVTGYHTRNPFMANVVNKANFTSYPKVLEMISRCEQLYEKVSERLVQDGKLGLFEDERLFINMIHRLNEQVVEGVDEGAPARKEGRRQALELLSVASASSKESWATSSLRQLVKENDASRLAGQVSESNEGNPDVDCDSDEDDQKQEALAKPSAIASSRKRVAGASVEKAGQKRVKD